MKNIIVIPARLASTRLPRKLLADLCGKTVIARVIERCKQSQKADAIMVATDSEEILREVQACGAEGIMTSADHCCGTDRIAEALEHNNAQHIVNVQGDEPFIDPALIDALFTSLEAGDEMVSAATDIEGDALADPSNVKVVLNAASYALYFSRSVIPYNRDNAYAGNYWWHLGIYGYQKETLSKLTSLEPAPLEIAESLEQLRALHHGISIKIITTTEKALAIDTPEDLEAAKQILKNRS